MNPNLDQPRPRPRPRRVMRTRRLTLRCMQAGDGILVHEAIVETLPRLRAWPASLPWSLCEPALDASEAYCGDCAVAFEAGSELAYLCLDHDGRFVALASLHTIDWSLPRFELGFWCRAAAQGRGYTSEAACELVRHAFLALGARRVDAMPDEANAASRKVCEAAGLQWEGTLRNDRRTPGGELRNTCVYARVCADTVPAGAVVQQPQGTLFGGRRELQGPAQRHMDSAA